MDETALLLALDTCEFLFLTEIGEPEANRLRLVVEEGRGSESPPAWSSVMDVQSMMCVR